MKALYNVYVPRSCYIPGVFHLREIIPNVFSENIKLDGKRNNGADFLSDMKDLLQSPWVSAKAKGIPETFSTLKKWLESIFL